MVEKYYKPHLSFPQTRSGSEAALLNNFIEKYKNKNYDQAVNILSQNEGDFRL